MSPSYDLGGSFPRQNLLTLTRQKELYCYFLFKWPLARWGLRSPSTPALSEPPLLPCCSSTRLHLSPPWTTASPLHSSTARESKRLRSHPRPTLAAASTALLFALAPQPLWNGSGGRAAQDPGLPHFPHSLWSEAPQGRGLDSIKD